MRHDVFKDLKPGDLVRHKGGSQAFIVHTNDGKTVTAVRLARLTNSAEWDKVDASGRVVDW